MSDPQRPTIEGGNGGNGEKPPIPEACATWIPEACATCNFWMPLVVNPRNKQGMGPCANQADAEKGVPFGVVLAGFASCGFWKEKENKTKIVTAPASVLNRMGGRKI